MAFYLRPSFFGERIVACRYLMKQPFGGSCLSACSDKPVRSKVTHKSLGLNRIRVQALQIGSIRTGARHPCGGLPALSQVVRPDRPEAGMARPDL